MVLFILSDVICNSVNERLSHFFTLVVVVVFFFKESGWCTNLESLCVGSSTSKLDFPHLFKNKRDNIISLNPEKVLYT